MGSTRTLFRRISLVGLAGFLGAAVCFGGLGLGALGLGDLIFCDLILAQQPEGTAEASPFDPDEPVLVALSKSDDWQFADAPLRDVVDYVGDKSGLDVVIDTLALDEYGIDQDTPITCDLKSVSLRSFLRLILREIDLTYEVRDGTLWITTLDSAEAHRGIRIYGVSDLIRVSDLRDESAYDYDSIINLITSNIAPSSWNEVGGPATIDGIYGSLVVSQTRTNHDDIERFLAAYRQIAKQHREQPDAPGKHVFAGKPEEDRIRATLATPVSFEIVDQPLTDVAQLMSSKAGIPVLIDARGLEEFGMSVDTPVTAKVTKLPLRFALRRVLFQLQLSWVVKDEVLMITTPEVCESILPICFYAVGDLVSPGTADAEDAPYQYDFDTLISVIESGVEPDTWDSVGGPSSIGANANPPALVISQTEDTHEKIAELLGRLRVAKQQERETIAASVGVAGTRRVMLHSYMITFGVPAQQVVDLIRRIIGEDEWAQNDVLLETLGETIVVRHTPRMHQRVKQLLNQLAPNSGGFGRGLGGGGGDGLPGGGGGGGFF